MIMKKVTPPTTRSMGLAGPRRVGVATAKACLSEVLRGLDESPVVIHSRGRDVGVLIDIGTYGRIAAASPPRAGGAAFLGAVEALRARFGGGVDDFEPASADLIPRAAFARRRPK